MCVVWLSSSIAPAEAASITLSIVCPLKNVLFEVPAPVLLPTETLILDSFKSTRAAMDDVPQIVSVIEIAAKNVVRILTTLVYDQ